MRFASNPLLAVVAAAATAGAFSPVVARAAGSEVSIRWATNATSVTLVTVEVHGLGQDTLSGLRDRDATDAAWQQLLVVYAGQGSVAADLNVPPMLGAYGVVKGVVRFTPRFPLQRGVTYRAVVRARGMLGRGSDASLSSTFSLPVEPRSPSTTVAAVYPSAEVLPENLLKFYVHFSAPMSRGHVYDHIRLLDAAGEPVELPFLEIDEELWDPALTRLTLFIDPGRIKRGVTPLEEIGPALEAGKAFTLVIAPAWLDAAGSPLVAGHEKKFRVTTPDREPPDPATWVVTPPASGGREPLVVAFPEPMDHALARRLIVVTDPAGRRIEGDVELGEQERLWRFRPAKPWRPGPGVIVVQTTIEDLAGNNLGKPFEVDLFDQVDRSLPGESVKLPFAVRK